MAVIRRIEDEACARALAAELLGNRRKVPTVAITAGAGTAGLIDPEPVADGVGDLADVVWMPSGDVTRAFEKAMPPMAQVFGDAARVYALDGSWVTDPRASRLHLCGTVARARRTEVDLVVEAMEAAAAAGLLQRRTAGTRVVDAEVRGFPSPGRAMLLGDFGNGFGFVREELVVPGVRIENVLAAGMRVRGRYDETSKHLDLTPALSTPDNALAGVSVGDVVPVRVAAVSRTVATLEPFPGRRVDVGAGQVAGDSDDDLRDLLTEGETVMARVVRTGPWSLSLLEVDDDAVTSAPSLIPGGPPWLAPPVAHEREPETLVAPHAERTPKPTPVDEWPDAPGPSWERERELREALEVEVAQLRRSLEAARAETTRREREVEKLRTERRGLLERARKGKGALGRRRSESFIDGEQQLRHDVYLAWAERIPPGEKDDRPLPADWTVGRGFVASLGTMPTEVRDKVPDVVMEVLLGIAEKSDGRDLHPLRVGAGGSDPFVERDPGERCWRVAVQRNTPSAARLHYWRKGDRIELSRVVRHDDMRP